MLKTQLKKPVKPLLTLQLQASKLFLMKWREENKNEALRNNY